MLATALLTLLFAPQAGPPEAAPEPPVVGRLADRPISLAEYQDFLWQRFGRRGLAEFADLLLLRAACDELGLDFDPAARDQAVEQRVAEMRRDLDEQAFLRELRASREDPESLRASLRLEIERLQRIDALVLATRVATDRALRTLFEERYGAGGVRTEVAHLLVMPQYLRAERIRGGTPVGEIDPEALRDEAQALAEECVRELAAGRDFAELVEAYSHDQVTRGDGGRLPAWRPGLYGPAFAAAVAALEPGAHSGVVESGAGFHVVRVLSRQVTRLEDVRAALVSEYLASEPSWQEREAALQALRGRTPLRID